MNKTITLSDNDLRYLKNLADICREDDLLDLQSYDSISRADRIQGAWEALKTIDRILVNNNLKIDKILNNNMKMEEIKNDIKVDVNKIEHLPEGQILVTLLINR